MAQQYRSKQLLDALQSQYSKYPIIREVTIIDPIESELSKAFYYSMYPDYYAPLMAKLGIKIEDLPDAGDWLPGRVPATRRIDALMVGNMDAYGEYPRTAIEVKISRADFRKDTDAKRRAWMSTCHRFVYLVPKGMITPEEVPEGCGLWYWEPSEFGGVGRITIAKRAKVNHAPDDFDKYFTAYMIGRLARAEAKRWS